MCGICGEVTFREGMGADPERVRSMMGLLAHRGPDGEGLWSEGGAALGHRRLSIIDPSPGGAQPMLSADGRYALVFNGAIYNFRELRAVLEAKGERFRSQSDTEVLLKALEVWGKEALLRLNGMWAFGLWDRREKRLLLARDRFGVKPLYWARVKAGIVFASEIPPLFEHPEVSRTLHPKALCEQVACRYVLAPRTLFAGIQKLPPGHLLTLQENKSSVVPYFALPMGERVVELDEDDALNRFDELFEASVKRRMVSDVPLGVLLSGGIDSSAVAAAVRHSGVDKISSFTVAFEGGGKFDEREWALRVASHLHTDHHEIVITPQAFAEGLPEVLGHLDDPVADYALHPLFFVCRMAKEHVTVLLSGQGADEVLGGYHLDRVMRQIRAVLWMRRLPGAGAAASLLASWNPKRAYLKRWDEIRRAVPGQIPARIRYDLTQPLGPEMMARLLKEPSSPPYDRTLDAFYTETPSHRGPLDAILAALCKGWLPDNLLNHSDRMSMASGIELRVPFLDPDLVAFCFRLPERFKVRRGVTKYLLKRYADLRGLPREVVHRRKRGFPVPWGEWLRGPLRERVRELILGADWMEAHFHRRGLEETFEEHLKGADHGILLWNLAVLAHWGRRMRL